MNLEKLLLDIYRSLRYQIWRSLTLTYTGILTAFLTIAIAFDLVVYRSLFHGPSLFTPFRVFLMFGGNFGAGMFWAWFKTRQKTLSQKELAHLLDKKFQLDSILINSVQNSSLLKQSSVQNHPGYRKIRENNPGSLLHYPIDLLDYLYFVPLLMLLLPIFLDRPNLMNTPHSALLSPAPPQATSTQNPRVSRSPSQKNEKRKKKEKQPNKSSNQEKNKNTKSEQTSSRSPEQMFGAPQKHSHNRIRKQLARQTEEGPEKQGKYLERPRHQNPKSASEAADSSSQSARNPRSKQGSRSNQQTSNPSAAKTESNKIDQEYIPKTDYSRESRRIIRNYFTPKE